MQPFDYFRPHSLEEASQLLAQAETRARVFAGGADLLPKLELGLVPAGRLIDIKHLPETTRFEFDSLGGFYCGAAVALSRLIEQSDIRRMFPLLAQVCERIASPQIRNRATVGGGICTAAANSSLAAALLCYDAVCHLFGPLGVREAPLSDFWTGPGLTILAPGELLTHLILPAPNRATRVAFHQVRSTQSGHGPLVGVAATASVDNEKGASWRLAVTGAAPYPYRAQQAEQLLAGPLPTPTRLAAAVAEIERSCRPVDDHRASAAYRRAMVAVLARRCLEELAGQLGGGSV